MDPLSVLALLFVAGLIISGIVLPVEFTIPEPEDQFEDERAMYEDNRTEIHAAGKAAATSMM
jgi:hypothetical protein